VRRLRGSVVVCVLVALTGCELEDDKTEQRHAVRAIGATDCRRDWVGDWRWLCRIVEDAGFLVVDHTERVRR
jgi:hypothetical protein